MRRRTFIAFLFTLVLARGVAPAQTPATRELQDLQSLQAFSAAFDSERGTARLVLLLSPT